MTKNKSQRSVLSSLLDSLDIFSANFLYIIFGGVSLGGYFFILIQNLATVIQKTEVGYGLGFIVALFSFGAIYIAKKDKPMKIIFMILIINSLVGLITLLLLVFLVNLSSLEGVIAFLVVAILFAHAVIAMFNYPCPKQE